MQINRIFDKVVKVVEGEVISLRTGSQVKQDEKENRRAKRAECGLGMKKGRGACRLCFDATHPSTCNYPVTHTSVTCQWAR